MASHTSAHILGTRRWVMTVEPARTRVSPLRLRSASTRSAAGLASIEVALFFNVGSGVMSATNKAARESVNRSFQAGIDSICDRTRCPAIGATRLKLRICVLTLNVVS